MEKFRNDSYLLSLSIKDHISELYHKDNYLKSIDASTASKDTSERLKEAYEKELADLYLLLTVFAEKHEDLIHSRIKRFKEKGDYGTSKGHTE